MFNFSQEQIFLLFCIIGLIIGIFYDFFRAIRKVFYSSDLVTLIEDILFLGISGYLIIASIIKLNGGEIRFFLFLGIFFGITTYLLTISNLCVIILYEFVKICKKIFDFIYFILNKQINLVKRLIKKDF